MKRNEIESYVTNALKMTKIFLDRYGPDHAVRRLLFNFYEILEFELPSPETDSQDLIEYINENMIPLLKDHLISSSQSEHLVKTAEDLLQIIEKQSTALNSQITKQMLLVYEQQRDEAKQWLRFTLVASVLGFLIIVAGIVFILVLARGPNFQTNITVGIVTSVSGVVINVISTLFLRQSDNASKQANSTLEKLDMFERFQISAKILSSFKKSDARSHSQS